MYNGLPSSAHLKTESKNNISTRHNFCSNEEAVSGSLFKLDTTKTPWDFNMFQGTVLSCNSFAHFRLENSGGGGGGKGWGVDSQRPKRGKEERETET